MRLIKKINRLFWYKYQYRNKNDFKITLASNWKIRIKCNNRELAEELYSVVEWLDIPKNTLRCKYRFKGRPSESLVFITWKNSIPVFKINLPKLFLYRLKKLNETYNK